MYRDTPLRFDSIRSNSNKKNQSHRLFSKERHYWKKKKKKIIGLLLLIDSIDATELQARNIMHTSKAHEFDKQYY